MTLCAKCINEVKDDGTQRPQLCDECKEKNNEVDEKELKKKCAKQYFAMMDILDKM